MADLLHTDLVGDLGRILALPSRPPLDCERDKSRKWSPQAQALIEVMTAKFSRGPRLSCGCRSRHVVAEPNGMLTVFAEARADGIPSLPLITTVDEFCKDNAHDVETVKIVQGLRPGTSVDLKGLGAQFCAKELNPFQAWLLRELPRIGGIFGMGSVGVGKTWAGILAPLAVNCRTVVLFAKPDQRLHYRNAYLRLREHFRVPSIVFDKGEGSFIVPGTPVLHFIPYSLLSNPRSTALLEDINPDMIVADEAHCLSAAPSSKSSGSSRTGRFLRYMAKNGHVKLCCWSGSIINKTMKDAAHLIGHSLGYGSPYPITPIEVDRWSAVIDPSPIPDRISPTAKSLQKAFGSNQFLDEALFSAGFFADSGVREGFRERVLTTPGVISTKSSSVNCSISISEYKPPKMPEIVREALVGVRNTNTRPDGEELVEQTEIALCARSVAAGFHYYWAYPKGEPEDLIKKWFAARKEWNKELRVKLLNSEPHLDSKSLCEHAAERAWRTPRYTGDLPVWQAESWPAWAEIKDQVDPDPRAKWIDDYLARDAAKWALENKGIVWCDSSALGRKVAEIAKLPYHCGGVDAEAKILAEDGSRSVIASINAHGESRDGLQHKFSEQLVLEIMPSGKRWQQLLGRLARQGQKEDTVKTWIPLHVSENKDAFRKAIMYAEFDEQMTSDRQLILAADLDFEI